MSLQSSGRTRRTAHRISRILFVVLVMTCVARAESDTLRHYSPKSKLFFYRDTSIQMQAARFELPAPGYVTSVILTLDGDSIGEAGRVRLFGSEGGLAAPLLEFDLAAPVVFRKQRRGIERVVVPLSSPALVTSHQMFVAIDRLAPGVSLLTDRRPKKPTCVSLEGSYGFQQLKLASGEWRSGLFAYAIDAVVEYPKRSSKGYLADVTEKAGLLDTTVGYRSLAWGDTDNDGNLDLLVGSTLYRNDGKGFFRDITEDAGIRPRAGAACFIDMDNDGDLDILAIHPADSGRAYLYTAVDGRFTSHALSLPPLYNPTSLSIADANSDGYLDLYAGQSGIVGADTLCGYLLLNDRANGFYVAPAETFTGSPRAAGSQGAQWTDVDDDGLPDLFLANAYGADQLWRNGGDGTFINQWDRAATAIGDTRAGGSIGGDWADHDNNGTLDLLLPASSGLKSVRQKGPDIDMVYTATERTLSPVDAPQPHIEYDYRQSSAAWGDVDNDGLLDFISTVSSSCHEARLYRQQSDGTFEQSSFEYGLGGLAIGHDAVWIDYDNDGKVDLATFVDGRFRLYRNSAPSANRSVSIELTDAAGHQVAGSIGARVTVHAQGRKYMRVATSGRGLLMQGPMRFTIGVGSDEKVDSVTVVLAGSGKRREAFTDTKVDELNRLTVRSTTDGGTASRARLTGAYPNPFTDDLTIAFTVPTAQHVRIEIYDLQGARLATIADGKYPPGEHTAIWTARDSQGQPMPQGSYIYRLNGEGGEEVGRAVLKR